MVNPFGGASGLQNFFATDELPLRVSGKSPGRNTVAFAELTTCEGVCPMGSTKGLENESLVLACASALTPQGQR